MKQMPLNIVLGSLVFFWSLSKELMIHIPSFFKVEVENLSSQQKQILEENGVGIQAYMDSVKEMYYSLTMLQNNQFINA